MIIFPLMLFGTTSAVRVSTFDEMSRALATEAALELTGDIEFDREIDIANRSVSIVGTGGTLLSGGHRTRLFRLRNASLHLHQIKLTRGSVIEEGGGLVYMEDSCLVAEDVEMTESSAYLSTWEIFLAAGTEQCLYFLTVVSCVLEVVIILVETKKF